MPGSGDPRAEFRVFGDGLIELVSVAVPGLATTVQDARAMPPELYVVSRVTDGAIVKVRDGLLDVKIKVGETPEGYEIFEPRAKLPFPVSRGSMSATLSALGVSSVLRRGTFTVDDLRDLAGRHPDLVATTVEKIRHGFTVGEVICEYAEIRFDGMRTESAACESSDHAAITPVATALGLSGRENLSYPRAAKRTLGLEPASTA